MANSDKVNKLILHDTYRHQKSDIRSSLAFNIEESLSCISGIWYSTFSVWERTWRMKEVNLGSTKRFRESFSGFFIIICTSRDFLESTMSDDVYFVMSFEAHIALDGR
jgi:hypothetical protein